MDTYKLLDLYKAAIDERRPFEGEMLTQIKNYYRIGLTWSSNALEGNTLTESETKVLLEDWLTVGGKPLQYTFEAIGHAKAYDFMFTLIISGYPVMTRIWLVVPKIVGLNTKLYLAL